VTVLVAKDAVRVLRFVAEMECAGGDEPFTGELLVELGNLVSADWIAYTEVDWVRRRHLVEVERPGKRYDVADWEQLSWNIADVHPTYRAQQHGRHLGAHKVSDFFSRTDFRRSRLYEWLQLHEVDHMMNLTIPSPPWNAKALLLDRGRGSRDFSERDRHVLDLLQPHFARLLHAARTRRLLRSALAELERGASEASHGVVLLGSSNQIEFATPSARRLLRRYFRSERPRAVAEWLEGPEGPLVRMQDARRLTIRLAGEALVLEERNTETELTLREREVLSWVARGKTNPEIAELLWVAPGTVRKHLENVYAKLGVNTRTAAVASFLGLLETEAS
jgi:DNA-binding CsgD family transcriptional regulator